jgi:serine phosphatase RsbU (regulator of sigma subunit)
MPDEAYTHEMRCMEIRGGNRSVEESLSTPGLDAWIYSRPYQEAEGGGDVYYLSLCGGGIITRAVVADVSGHGAGVAVLSTALRGLMRKNINTKDQTRLVRALNRELALQAEMRWFATAVVATYLATDRRLTVCNAGHPRPLWYRAGHREWGLLDVDSADTGNLPLGIDDESAYSQFAVTLDAGDVVLVYTDAFIEAADPSGQMLGEEGLLGLARALDPSDPRGAGAALIDALDAFRGSRPADDDVTILAFRHTAAGPRHPGLGERLDVYAKFFGLKHY